MNFDDLKRFQDGLCDMGIAGSDLAVYLGYRPVYRHFSGWQDPVRGIKINERTLYRMFSMTKLLTCTAGMQLLEKGRFLMNDPVSEYLPEFARPQVREADGTVRPAAGPLLIHHLFTMTSGIDYDLSEPCMKEALERYGRSISTRQLVSAIAQKPLQFDPGAHWLYGLSHDVLGALIEVISGQKFSEYMKENIFLPLGMEETWFREPESRAQDVCVRCKKDADGNIVPADGNNFLQPGDEYESGGAGLTMTVDDYARFARALTAGGKLPGGERILSGRYVDLMRANTLNAVQLADMHRTPANQGYGYGFGMRTMVDPALSGSPTPPGEFGWAGAWGSYTLLDPENKVTIVYAEQAEDTKEPYIHRRIRNMTYAALEWEGLLP